TPMPLRRSSSSCCRRGRVAPSTSTVPAAGCSSPVSAASSVDLPLPDGPSTAVTLPRGTTRSMASSTVRPPRSRRTSVRRTAGRSECIGVQWGRSGKSGKAWPSAAEWRRSGPALSQLGRGFRIDRRERPGGRPSRSGMHAALPTGDLRRCDGSPAHCMAMPTAPDFRLYHSNALEVLAGLLAEETVRLPADGDWLRPDLVLVPQHSMRRWLQQALAERLGICANLRFVTPGEFVDMAVDANLGTAPPEDRLGPEVLRWHLLHALQQSPPAALAAFLGNAALDNVGLRNGEAAIDPLKPWSLAGALADTFEKYQAWRRDWLLAWERRAPADDWQATLWRQVARGRQHRARRIDAYLQRFGAHGEPP